MKKKILMPSLIIFLFMLSLARIIFPEEPIGRFLAKAINKPSEIISRKSATYAEKFENQVNLLEACQGVRANVIKRQIGPYQRKILVKLEGDQQIYSGQLAVSGDIFVGQVDKISENRAWIKLISDPSFRLPVIIDGVPAIVILKGNVTSLLVDRVPGDNPIGGKKVVSAGTGENQLSGVKIGEIEKELESTLEGRLRTFTVLTKNREEFINQVTVCNEGVNF